MKKKPSKSNGVSKLKLDQRGNLPSIKAEKMDPVPDFAADKLPPNQGRKTSPETPKRGLQSPETGVTPSQSGMEGSPPSTIREKVSEDGYNWRKYGQKLVKGNEYVRSYYRCTHPNCQVKKQLEQLHEGKVVDIVYLGQHDHPKPQLNIPVALGLVGSIAEERPKEPSLTTAQDTSVDEHSQQPPQANPVDTPRVSNVSAKDNIKATFSKSNKAKDEVCSDDDPDSKRQKRDKDNLKTIAPEKSTSKHRVIVQTVSEVDIVNDGYRWRKYGQKLVKDNPNPRSYYRCSNSGCPVKKHVERASHDPRKVMTTYEGQHNHEMPPTRTVTHNVSDPNESPTPDNGATQEEEKSTSRSPLNGTETSNMVVDCDPDSEIKPQNNKSVTMRSCQNR